MGNYDWKYDFEKRPNKQHFKEEKAGGFKCLHCKQFVVINDFMGTTHRNHCTYCLWSKHVDLDKPGDRKATCLGGMKPIGLTFKNEAPDKYGKKRLGELKVVHWCVLDMTISTNRIAADDNTDEIFLILTESLSLNKELKEQLKDNNIVLLDKKDEKEIMAQLFGKKGY